jgi:peptide/nickel transport system substrate-binding protein
MSAPQGKREFRILGPFEARENEHILEVGPGKQQALLALLLLDAGEVVSTGRLIDALWGESPPASALNSVHVYVSRLRKVLGEGYLITRGHGYQLVLEPEQLDLARFERLLDEGRELLTSGEAKRASELLRAALGLWRGPPLPDFASEPFAEVEIARLEELRLAALEERIEADLALGRHGELVPELGALVRTNPLRERVHAQLMLALYRSGRQAEALDVYRQARKTLIEGLGLEPGRRLQELERAILSQDPTLDLPAPAAARLRRARRRGGLLIAIGATLLLAAAVAVAVIELTRGGGTGRVNLGEREGNVVGIVDQVSGGVIDAVQAPAPPSAMAVGLGYVWTASADSNEVFAIDPSTNTVRQQIQVESAPGGIAIGGGWIWVTNSLTGTVSQISPEALIVVQTISVGNGPTGIAFGNGHVWVANTFDNTVMKLRASDGKKLGTFTAGSDPGALAVGEGAVWIASKLTGTVAKLSPSTGEILDRIHVGDLPAVVGVVKGSVWVANSSGTVNRIDPRTDDVRTLDVGSSADALAVDRGDVWVASELAGEVSRIDAEGRRVATVDVGNRPTALAARKGRLYVGLRPGGASHVGGTLRIVFPRDEPGPPELDPAYVGPFSMSLIPLRHDGLVGWKRVGGQASVELVPDLARRLPLVSEDHRTYTFQLRPGIHYSDGRLVKASDVRDSLERVLKAGAGDFYRAIVGADRCSRRRCDLARGIATDDRTGTVVFHLSAPDPEFRFKLAAPVASVLPKETPLREAVARPLPATGPYRLASVAPNGSVRFVRNERFREWSSSAQPAGFPKEIVFRLVRSDARRVQLVVQGKADLTMAPGGRPLPVPPVYRPQLHAQPRLATFFLYLDVTRPPFDDVRVRRAVNYALNREKFVRLAGGSDAGRPTCQVLPPNFPAYKRYCPFTLDPSRSWSAPDVATARSLVDDSGTAGTRVTLWWPPFFSEQQGRYVQELLDSLGYRTRRVSPFRATRHYFAALGRPGAPWQIAGGGWLADLPAASNFITPLLSCSSPANAGHFCDRAIDAAIRRARELQERDPVAAKESWTALDRRLTNRAPWVFLYTPNRVDFLSKRVGNYQHHLVWEELFAQLWVR